MFLFLYHITLFIRTKKSRRAWRNSETAKRLADFLVICSYVNKLKSDEARAEQQARLIAMPSRGCYFSEAKERFFHPQIIIINFSIFQSFRA